MMDIALVNLCHQAERLTESLAALEVSASEQTLVWKAEVEGFVSKLVRPLSEEDKQKIQALITLTDRLDKALGDYGIAIKAQQEAAQRQYQMAHKYIVNG